MSLENKEIIAYIQGDVDSKGYKACQILFDGVDEKGMLAALTEALVVNDRKSNLLSAFAYGKLSEKQNQAIQSAILKSKNLISHIFNVGDASCFIHVNPNLLDLHSYWLRRYQDEPIHLLDLTSHWVQRCLDKSITIPEGDADFLDDFMCAAFKVEIDGCYLYEIMDDISFYRKNIINSSFHRECMDVISLWAWFPHNELIQKALLPRLC